MALKTIVDVVRMQRHREKRRNDCCRAVWNIEQVDSDRDDLLIEQCKVCRCRHRIALAQPGHLGTVFGAAGRTAGAIVIGLLLTASLAAAQDAPWIVYGQTAPICQGGISNPKPNVNGLIGEVTALPYTVPENKTLIVEAYGLEAYGNVPGGLVLVPYLGATPPANNNAFLHSVFSDNASNEQIGLEFHIPAGKVFNLLLMSNECPAQIVGWYVKGRLATP